MEYMVYSSMDNAEGPVFSNPDSAIEYALEYCHELAEDGWEFERSGQRLFEASASHPDGRNGYVRLFRRD